MRLSIRLLSGAALVLFFVMETAAQSQTQEQPAALKTTRDWNRLRMQARTADEFRQLAQWCQMQVDLNNKKALAYETKLREYYANPAAYPHPKYPPTDLTLRTLIAHHRDLSRQWSVRAAKMNSKVADLDAAPAAK